MRLAVNAAWIGVSLKLGTILAPLAAVMIAIMALSPDAPRPVDERAAPFRSAHDAAPAPARPPVSAPSVGHRI